MKKLIYNNHEYDLIEDYKSGFEKDALDEKMTDYFENYDYIVGDWSYGKLRLKGFCDKGNSLYKGLNDIKNKEQYIKKQCSYDCRYFVLKRLKISQISKN